MAGNRRLPLTFFMMICLLVAPAHAEDAGTQQVPADIPADLSEDVTDALQAWIDSVPDGSTLIFPEHARYRIEGTLTIAGREDLTIDGNGALFRSTDKVTEGGRLDIRNRAHWRVSDGSRRITLRNIHVHGPNEAGGVADEACDADREAQHAFDIDGAEHVTLENVRGQHVFGDGVYVRSDHVVVRDSRLHNIGRQGIAIANARDVLIERNDLRDVRRGIFNIEQYGADWRSDNVRILNNTTGRSRLLWMPVSGSGVAGSVLVASNVVEAGTGVPVITNEARESGRRGPFVAIGDRFISGGSPQPAFRFSGIDGLLFAGNTATLPEHRDMAAVRVEASTAAVVVGNSFEGAGEAVVFDEATRGYRKAEDMHTEGLIMPIANGWAARVNTPDGPIIAVWRMGESDRESPGLAAMEVQTEADMVIIHLDDDEEEIRHVEIVGEGRTTFRGSAIEGADE